MLKTFLTHTSDFILLVIPMISLLSKFGYLLKKKNERRKKERKIEFNNVVKGIYRTHNFDDTDNYITKFNRIMWQM